MTQFFQLISQDILKCEDVTGLKLFSSHERELPKTEQITVGIPTETDSTVVLFISYSDLSWA